MKMHPVEFKERGYSAIGLFNPKTPTNVGSALRACACYGASMLAMTGDRFHGAPTDTFKTYKHIPLLQVNNLYDVIPYDCVPVAVDLIDSATNLIDYKHPERAFYVFGPEDGTLEKQVLSWCRNVIYIPTLGCMNLAATVNVILYDRMVKSKKQGEYNNDSNR